MQLPLAPRQCRGVGILFFAAKSSAAVGRAGALYLMVCLYTSSGACAATALSGRLRRACDGAAARVLGAAAARAPARARPHGPHKQRPPPPRPAPQPADVSRVFTFVGIVCAFLSTFFAHGFLTLARQALNEGKAVKRSFLVSNLVRSNPFESVRTRLSSSLKSWQLTAARDPGPARRRSAVAARLAARLGAAPPAALAAAAGGPAPSRSAPSRRRLDTTC